MRKAGSFYTHGIAILVWQCLLVCIHASTEWINPKSGEIVRLASDPQGNGELRHFYVGENRLNFMSESPLRRENHGFGWQSDVQAHWHDDRFLIFEDDMGLCVVDTDEKTVLLNNIFTGLSRDPADNRWVAIRYRPVTRHQEQLTGDEKDTLLLIEPESMAKNIKNITQSNPLGHIISTQLDGIALSRPIWKKEGNGFVVASLIEGKFFAQLFDSDRLRIVRTQELNGVILSSDKILSPWLRDDVESMIKKAVETSGILSATRQENDLEAETVPPMSSKSPDREDAATQPSSGIAPRNLSIIAAAVLLGIIFCVYLVLRKYRKT